MICPRCGVINTDGAERCTRCRGSLAPAPPPSVGQAAAPGADVAAPAPVVLPPPPPVPTPAWDPTSGQPAPPPSGPPSWPAPPVGTAPAPAGSWSPPPPYGSVPAWTPEGQDRAPGAAAGWPAPPSPPPGPWQPPAPRQAKRRPAPATWPGPSEDRTWKPEGTLPTYLPWAVLCTILLFPVGGIVAIVYGVLVNRRAAAGDYEGASRASRLARRWCLISVAVGAVALLLLASGVLKNPYTTN